MRRGLLTVCDVSRLLLMLFSLFCCAGGSRGAHRSFSSGMGRIDHLSFQNPAVSKASGRTFLAGAISLADNPESRERLRAFLSSWGRAWSSLRIKRQISFRNNARLRGLGLLASYYTLLQEAVDMDFDYMIVFEDDAIPFDGVSWPNESPNDLDDMLDKLEQRRGTGLFLGGHEFKNVKREQIQAELPQGIVQATSGFGSYAVVIPKRYIEYFTSAFGKLLSMDPKNTEACTGSGLLLGVDLGVDNWLWSIMNDIKNITDTTGGYVSTPLVVDHMHGYSNTWGEYSVREFEGSRVFWKQ